VVNKVKSFDVLLVVVNKVFVVFIIDELVGLNKKVDIDC